MKPVANVKKMVTQYELGRLNIKDYPHIVFEERSLNIPKVSKAEVNYLRILKNQYLDKLPKDCFAYWIAKNALNGNSKIKEVFNIYANNTEINWAHSFEELKFLLVAYNAN